MKQLIRSIALALAVAGAVISCSNDKTVTGSNISEAAISKAVSELAPNAIDAQLMERGVRGCASLWRESDGGETEFIDFVLSSYENTPEGKRKLFDRVSYAMEAISGCSNDLALRLQRPTVLAGDEPTAIDYAFSAFSPFSHLSEDLYGNKIAFIIALNFPFYSLAEKNALGMDWDELQWAYARMGDMYTGRHPAEISQAFSAANSAAENYIASYNIMMGHLLTEDGERLFPEDMCLLAHWNLRDEIKADYADVPNAAAKQEMIFKVMEHIVLQDIPQCVINNPEYDWKPYSNTVWKDGKEIAAEPEGAERYARILDVFHANQALDAWDPQMPSGIIRNFESSMEVSDEVIEKLFVRLVGSDEIKATGKLIASRLGRELRPFDIWYDGFKSRSTMSEDNLTAQTRALYPNAAAFKKGMPEMLRKMGFSAEDADYIADKIDVEGARGSGHAWPSQSRWQPSLLRTRIGAEGMDYKGYNIAVHEFGHNVEETLDLYYVDHYIMSGIPNSALTETMAFVFQKRDLQLLGYPFAGVDENTTLDIFWGAYEIMGVALTDMYTWRWLYDNPSATAEQLRDAVVRIACDVWNQYYEPVLGTHDCPLLAVYSHMVNSPMYLPNYPYGHVVEYQLEEYLSQFTNRADFANELKRVFSQGRVTPDVWMKRAVGEEVSVEPLIRAAGKIVNR